MAFGFRGKRAVRPQTDRAVSGHSQAGMSRRELLKLGAVTGTGSVVSMVGGANLLLPRSAGAKELPVASPWDPSWAFVQPMPIPQVLQPTLAMTGPPPQDQPYTKAYCTANNIPAYRMFNDATLTFDNFYEARTERHQRWTEAPFNNVDPVWSNGKLVRSGVFNGKMYELSACELDWCFYPDAANAYCVDSKIWTFHDHNSTAAGLVRLNAHYGEPVLMRMHNCMPADNRGCGINQMSTHLHNAHNPSESDGGPLRFFNSGEYYDYWYPNIRAGFSGTHKAGTYYTGLDGIARLCPGDFRETQSTLWFHDHRMDFTSQNVYKGLVGFYTLFSDDINLDTGMGEDPDPAKRGLGLPSGDFDVPIAFSDKRFDPNTGGEMSFDTTDFAGHIGDLMTVNFKIKPYFEVQKRRYRLRLLNACPSRYIELSFSNGMTFVRIANDGNLMPKAQRLTSVRLAPAERADIIVDFSPAMLLSGSKIYLENRLEQKDGARSTGNILPSSPNPRLAGATQILEFRIGGKLKVADKSRTLAELLAQPLLLELPKIPAATAAKPRKQRSFDFSTSSGQWVVNGKFFDPSVISAYPIEGTAEEWTITSGGGWGHPVHVHHDEGQVLQRDGKPVATTSDDYSRKDVYRIGDGAVGANNTGSLTFVMQFRDWYGDFPMHCHNIVHEDHAMMVRFKVVPPTDPNAGK